MDEVVDEVGWVVATDKVDCMVTLVSAAGVLIVPVVVVSGDCLGLLEDSEVVGKP